MSQAAHKCTKADQAAGRAPEPRYFFEDGLRFSCQRCGRCCTGGPGRVGLTEEEAVRMGRFLGMTPEAFLAHHVRRLDGRLALKEKENGDCIFYREGCTIYPVRPAQCRTFPFWTRNLRTEEAWRETARDCPGIGQGELHDRAAILKQIEASPI